MRVPPAVPHLAALLLALTLLTAGCAADLTTLRQTAEGGDVKAQLSLAKRYSEGKGVPRDAAEAARWLRRAADQGSGEAQLSLGILCRDGVGVPQDFEEARRWIQQAADGGTGAAQYLLGLMYEDGAGVPRDLLRAHLWFNLATSTLPEDDREAAVRKREWLQAVLTPADLAAAQRLAREWTAARGSRAGKGVPTPAR